MENTFFLPVGKTVLVEMVGNYSTEGEFRGVINFGGIPAIWITEDYPTIDSNNKASMRDVVCLIQNVICMSIVKEKSNDPKILSL